MRKNLIGLAWLAIGLACLALVLAGCGTGAPPADIGMGATVTLTPAAK